MPSDDSRAPDAPPERWREQLRRGGLELAILLAAARTPRYGLEIIRFLDEATDLVVSEGTIYPILGRLTRRGALAAEWVADQSPHPRKYYRLSAAGRRELDAMLGHWHTFRDKIDRLIEKVEGTDL